MDITRLGLGFPNRHLLADDIPRMVACGARDFVVYVFDDDFPYWRAQIIALRQACPSCHIHLRLERRGALDAQGDAERVRRAWEHVGGLVDSICIRNEPNIESPGVTPDQWHAYLVAFGDAIARLKLPIPVFAAPISPGTSDAQSWIQATCDAARGSFLGLWIHAYGDLGLVEGIYREYRAVWPGRLICTEFNFGAGLSANLSNFAATIPQHLQLAQRYGIEALNLFTWQWNNPDLSLPTTVDVRGTAVETFLRTWRPNVTNPVYDVGKGVTDLMAKKNDVPHSNENYVANVKGIEYKSETFGGKGLYLWNKATGETSFVPFG